MVRRDIDRARRHFNPKKVKVDPKRVVQEIEQLGKSDGSYEDLMNGYNKGLVMWAERYLRHEPQILEEIDRIKREALKVSIRNAAREDSLKRAELCRNYPYLDKATRDLYPRNEKSSLVLLAEDAGVTFFEKPKAVKPIRRPARKSQRQILAEESQLKKEKVPERLDEIEEESISYQDLIAKYGRELFWAKQYLKKDLDSQRRIKKIKIEALKVSIRRIANGSPMSSRQICEDYSRLEKAARGVYTPRKGRSVIRQLVENAGVIYVDNSPRANTPTLRELLRKISAIGDEPDDFIGDTFKINARTLGRQISRRFKFWGKGAILVGVDYLSVPIQGLRKPRYVFSLEELSSIARDGSLSENEKARCLFNALSLQYYEFLDGCPVVKDLNGVCYLDFTERQDYLNGKLEITIAKEVFDDVDCAVGIYFSDNSRFRGASLEFSGENAEKAGMAFYNGLENKLRFLKER